MHAPEIDFAMHDTTRQTHTQRMLDEKLAKKIARYLKVTENLKITMSPSQERIQA